MTKINCRFPVPWYQTKFRLFNQADIKIGIARCKDRLLSFFFRNIVYRIPFIDK